MELVKLNESGSALLRYRRRVCSSSMRRTSRMHSNLQDGDVIQSIDGREPTFGCAHALRILGVLPGRRAHSKLGIMRDKRRQTIEYRDSGRPHEPASWPEMPPARGGAGATDAP